ncbi:hypothetical protein [Streptomyces sp. NPDC094466]|uniref:hypothetical protein n=1 Tax=Streptomyces sp. NPDC094466 TaxID=3366065 RepID=UPI0038300BAD
MTTEPRTFPPRTLSAVTAVYARQAGCPSSFALAVADFGHEVDSHPRAFRQVGRQAVQNALVAAYGPPSTPWPRLP